MFGSLRGLVLGVIVFFATGCAPVQARQPGSAAPHPRPVASPSETAAVPAESAGETAAETATRWFGHYFAPGDAYELDELDRSGPERGKKPLCTRDAIVAYRGTALHYEAPASVHRAFTVRLARFEEVVREVAIEVYGR